MAEKEKKEEVELTEVVTQTAQAFKLPNGEVVDVNGLLVLIANELLTLKKGLI